MIKNLLDLSAHVSIVTGSIMIFIALLLIVMPELLSWFIASIILTVGVYLLIAGIRNKKLAQESQDDFIYYS